MNETEELKELMGALIPTVGVIGTVARLLTLLLKEAGVDTASFDKDLDAFDQARGVLVSRYQEILKKYPPGHSLGQRE